LVLGIACAFLAREVFFGGHARAKRAAAERDRGERETGTSGYDDHRHPDPPTTPGAVAHAISRVLPATPAAPGATAAQVDDDEPASTQQWLVAFFRPHPGETLTEYRDRMLPVAKASRTPRSSPTRRSRRSTARSRPPATG
jgi:hypothetical protein